MRKFLIAFLLVSLTACGAGAPAPETDSTGANPPASAPATSPAASPADDPAASPDASEAATDGNNGMNLGNLGEFEQRVISTLSTQFNLPADALQLVSREETEWSDGSLGCPDPAALYMQVITPGYKMTFTDGTQTYDVRTNADGSQVVWCNNGQPVNVGQP